MDTIEKANTMDLTTAHIGARVALQSLGDILVKAGKLQPQDAEQIIQYQHIHRVRFGEAAIKLKLISSDDLEFALASQFSYPYLHSGEGGFSKDLIAAYKPFSKQVEALRAVRSHLMLRWFTDERKVLTVVSPGTQEGRSYTIANLGVVFSQLGERTLLIDADLRTPRLHTIFNLTNDVGLSSLLSGRQTANVIQRVDKFSNLSVLPAGPIPPNPLELLSNAAFTRLLASVHAEYDVVLMDTPAANLYTDSEIIASRAGGVLVIANKGKTRLKDVKRLTERLKSDGMLVVGSVLNEG